MKKITQEEIANKINVTSRTVRNWENEKPELLRLLRMAMEHESFYIDFWELFNNIKSIILLDNFYVDFYFKFLNYFRKNITMYSRNDDRSTTDIIKTLIIYLIQHNKDELFDRELSISDEDIRKFERDELISPLLANYDEELSEYILRNTIDDFETLVQDSVGVDKQFIEAIKISIYYVVFKYEPYMPFTEKIKISREMIRKIGVDRTTLKNTTKINKKTLFKTYINVKDEFSMEYLDLLNREPDYKSNSFYVPPMIKRMENKNLIREGSH